MRARVSWAEGTRFVGAADSGHGVLMESKSGETPPVGASPMEMVLMGLGGCSSVDVVDILRKMRQELASLDVVLHAERAAEPPRVFLKVDMEFVASGDGLTEDSLKRAVDLSMEKYCSVAAMLRKGGTRITYRYRLKVRESPELPPEVGKKVAPPGLHAEAFPPQAEPDLPFPAGPGPMPHGRAG